MSLSEEQAQSLSAETVVVAAGRPARERDQPVNPPIVLSSTYFGTGPLADGERGYGRYANPSWGPFEEALGQLEGATLPGLLYASGLAAVSSALTLIPAGGVLVMPSHSYAGSLVMATELAEKGFLELRTVDISDTDAVRAELAPEAGRPASMLWLESPTNPMLGIADIRALTAAAHDVGAIVVTDNTFSTPLVQQPLSLGSDVVLHSVTKYLAGHSDVVLGALVTSNPDIRAALLHNRIIHGAIAGPFEAWLALRGLRTLALRIERSQASAAVLAERLSTHPLVESIRYPGLPSDPGHERATAQMRGFGSVLCIQVAPAAGLDGAAAADRLVQELKLWLPATSLGGVESLIERRRRHLAEPLSVPENLVRLSVGIENVQDLWADLEQAFAVLEG
ncbi:aminotransferase class I/II-fold pyridoxal phosphate-dependent enzyme [Pseudarthrobacter sp. J75]|uniref:trans-sulfuration enzyme family protein n=1 Tax=unclassified Pseudarthrobacter TaxID=2647000 RepID=UPI002E81E927|nr:MULTISPECIES: aminotransferase class I/II-fold pyridoxal phosphate-dependent enzyme [unclassified Pseudarthrobacter]MEE2522406.1 aminotransferase class I/II-fold pyridoxal phosphate-dependent enzyme [Pseudarthrobacter sp. J47]MEE2529263.1 aminotransferase class I/II-fold pyridoxal phosphate-dependent enzyme [Pseudarthrobacter sp. J75]MEE2570933.1 aminotransferase class I/II-fold pyridoxal phosphate-dependent enzyme [Pseudarthrobacter sp. J64]